jgi:hypothetical protein
LRSLNVDCASLHLSVGLHDVWWDGCTTKDLLQHNT